MQQTTTILISNTKAAGRTFVAVYWHGCQRDVAVFMCCWSTRVCVCVWLWQHTHTHTHTHTPWNWL